MFLSVLMNGKNPPLGACLCGQVFGEPEWFKTVSARALSKTIIYLKSHSTLTFGTLFKTSHCSSFLQVTPR